MTRGFHPYLQPSQVWQARRLKSCMGAVGSGPFAGNDCNRRRNLVTGYTKYNTYTPITQLNQLNYDARCSLETSIKLTRVTRGFEPRYRGSARAGQTTEPSAGRKPAARAKRQDMNVSNHCRRIISVLQRHRGAGASAAERSGAAGATSD